MFGLTVELSVVPGESLTNFLQRVAGANFLKLTDLVTHLRDSTQPNIFPDSLLPTTWRSAYEHLTSQTTNRTWSCLKPKICASCFSEHQQIKEPWNLTLNTVCASHNCQWPLILTHFWPIELTHLLTANRRFSASNDSSHLPA